jgi:hypothetical protein
LIGVPESFPATPRMIVDEAAVCFLAALHAIVLATAMMRRWRM